MPSARTLPSAKPCALFTLRDRYQINILHPGHPFSVQVLVEFSIIRGVCVSVVIIVTWMWYWYGENGTICLLWPIVVATRIEAMPHWWAMGGCFRNVSVWECVRFLSESLVLRDLCNYSTIWRMFFVLNARSNMQSNVVALCMFMLCVYRVLCPFLGRDVRRYIYLVLHAFSYSRK